MAQAGKKLQKFGRAKLYFCRQPRAPWATLYVEGPLWSPSRRRACNTHTHSPPGRRVAHAASPSGACNGRALCCTHTRTHAHAAGDFHAGIGFRRSGFRFPRRRTSERVLFESCGSCGSAYRPVMTTSSTGSQPRFACLAFRLPVRSAVRVRWRPNRRPACASRPPRGEVPRGPRGEGVHLVEGAARGWAEGASKGWPACYSY